LTTDDFPNVAEWGIEPFSPGELRSSTRPLLNWLATTGCSHVAIHFEVDTIDSIEIMLGLGAEPDGLTSTEVRRIVADIDAAIDGRRVHRRGIHTSTGDPPAADPQRLPVDLRNDSDPTPVTSSV
jgi:hypothetical protein